MWVALKYSLDPPNSKTYLEFKMHVFKNNARTKNRYKLLLLDND